MNTDKGMGLFEASPDAIGTSADPRCLREPLRPFCGLLYNTEPGGVRRREAVSPRVAGALRRRSGQATRLGALSYRRSR
jgi:hypothetical protein